MTGIYFRVERDGAWLTLDLAEMTEREIEVALLDWPKESLIRTVVALVGQVR